MGGNGWWGGGQKKNEQEEDKECRKRKEGHERGGLRVHGRQERRGEKEVLGDLIIRLSSKVLHQQYFSMEMKALLAGKKPNLLFLIG